MKAIKITKPNEISIEETEKPQVKQGEALLKVKYCGICGADVASFTGNQPFTTYPRIPGHEFSAEVVAVPDNNAGIQAGDIVTVNPYFNCGACYSCRRGFVNCCEDNQTMGVQRDGSFCEYVSIPVERLISGKGLTAQQLALIEPLTIGYHASKRVQIKPTDKVLVIGAGPIGLFALISAKLFGAQVYVSDVLDGRLEKALQYGADGVVNVSKTKLSDYTASVTDGGFDVCMEACGSSRTFLDAIDNAAFAGRIILIGNGKTDTTFLHSIILKKELNIFGSRNSYRQDFEEAIDFVSRGKIDVMKMVSNIYPLGEADKAFRALSTNDGSLAKVLIEISK